MTTAAPAAVLLMPPADSIMAAGVVVFLNRHCLSPDLHEPAQTKTSGECQYLGMSKNIYFGTRLPQHWRFNSAVSYQQSINPEVECYNRLDAYVLERYRWLSG